MQGVGQLAVITLLVLGVSIPAAAASTVPPQESSEESWTKTMMSEFGVSYQLIFDKEELSVNININNPTNETVPSGIDLSTDKRTIHSSNFRLSPGENWSTTVDIRPALDVLESEHVVQASTFGATTKFEFEYAIDAERTAEVPKPYIANATVTQGTIDGSQSTVVNVTIVNPSEQLYPTKLMVHTEATDGSLYLPTARSGEKTTVTVELLDDPDSVVVGQARLYANDLDDSSGGIDQIGFQGRVDGNTSTWNESYSAIEGPWSDDAYSYQNSSVDQPGFAERVSDGRDVNGVPLVFPAVAAVVAILVGLLVVRRR